jgi:GPH family glycoside/pentoside/hexuronide:cation symporter
MQAQALSAKISASDEVPLKTKLAYGAAGAVDNIAINLPGQLAAPIYSTGLGLSPALVSISILIFRSYDAVLDPLLGWISDNTRSRYGRRKPFIVAGAILLGLWFPVMWFAGRTWSHEALTLWLIGTGLIFYTFFSIWSMPYQCMLLEMTPDYHERTNISSYRAFFQTLAGLVLGWAWYFTKRLWIRRKFHYSTTFGGRYPINHF